MNAATIGAKLGLALVCALAPLVLVAQPAAKTAKTDAAAPADQVLSEGVVNKVDRGAGKVTIQHGQIKNLGMAPMTMMFHVKDPAMLEQVQTGQKIRFHVDIVNGAYTVLRMEPVK